MNTIDAAVRDLLAAIDLALDAPEATKPSLRAAIRTAGYDGGSGSIADAAEWLGDRLACEDGEAADANRVRFADRWDQHQASKELPA
jgi:hypothetical protein